MITGAWGIGNMQEIKGLYWFFEITGVRIQFGNHIWKQGRQIQFWPSQEFGGM